MRDGENLLAMSDYEDWWGIEKVPHLFFYLWAVHAYADMQEDRVWFSSG